jgi:2-succinyl-6-hydroxy-2,4-cyclohexadiene-1-carboxylate synthase
MDRPRQANLLRCFSIANQPEFWQAMKAWEFPVLGISGERDDRYTQVIIAMRSRIPLMHHCVITAAGHAVHRESPEQVAAAIHAFVAPIIAKEEKDEHV